MNVLCCTSWLHVYMYNYPKIAVLILSILVHFNTVIDVCYFYHKIIIIFFNLICNI